VPAGSPVKAAIAAARIAVGRLRPIVRVRRERIAASPQAMTR